MGGGAEEPPPPQAVRAASASRAEPERSLFIGDMIISSQAGQQDGEILVVHGAVAVQVAGGIGGAVVLREEEQVAEIRHAIPVQVQGLHGHGGRAGGRAGPAAGGGDGVGPCGGGGRVDPAGGDGTPAGGPGDALAGGVRHRGCEGEGPTGGEGGGGGNHGDHDGGGVVDGHGGRGRDGRSLVARRRDGVDSLCGRCRVGGGGAADGLGGVHGAAAGGHGPVHLVVGGVIGHGGREGTDGGRGRAQCHADLGRLQLPHPAAVGGSAEERTVRGDVEVPHGHQGQVAAEAAPGGAAVAARIHAEVGAGEQGLVLGGVDPDHMNGDAEGEAVAGGGAAVDGGPAGAAVGALPQVVDGGIGGHGPDIDGGGRGGIEGDAA